MPELPEVETIRRQLYSELKKKKITGIEIRLPRLVRGSVLSFKKGVLGSTVTDVRRRAKILILHLSNGFSIIIHLKLTGQLIYKKKNKVKIGGHPIKDGDKDLPNKYTQAIFIFKDGSKLFFNDLRKFGYFRLAKTTDLETMFQKEKFGPEPLDKRFTLEVFQALLNKKKITKIKPLLMDQTFMAGLGNIYATEACFEAGIKPTRPAGLLKPAKVIVLFKAVKRILLEAIKKQGSSSNTYVDAYGQPGGYVPLLKVYGRKGRPCRRCRTKIKSINLAGRGTAYCPKCQK